MSKYGAVPTEVDGIRFASRAEAERYRALSLLETGGIIRELELQPRYDLVVNGARIGRYVADFRYWDNERNVAVVEDVKGYRTPVYKLKRALVKALYGIDITEVDA